MGMAPEKTMMNKTVKTITKAIVLLICCVVLVNGAVPKHINEIKSVTVMANVLSMCPYLLNQYTLQEIRQEIINYLKSNGEMPITLTSDPTSSPKNNFGDNTSSEFTILKDNTRTRNMESVFCGTHNNVFNDTVNVIKMNSFQIHENLYGPHHSIRTVLNLISLPRAGIDGDAFSIVVADLSASLINGFNENPTRV